MDMTCRVPDWGSSVRITIETSGRQSVRLWALAGLVGLLLGAALQSAGIVVPAVALVFARTALYVLARR